MKKILSMIFVCMFLMAPSALAIDLYVDGVKLQTDTEPMIKNSRTLVPVRAIFEALDAEVFWNGEERSVTATKDGITVYLKIDDTIAYVNGDQKILDVPAQIVNSRTMVPARFVAEALEADVKWDNNTRTVYVTTNPAAQPEPEPAGVYITPTGKRYHFDKECAGKNAIPSTLQMATGKGLTPCKTCAQ